jgi:hypothetical protein
MLETLHSICTENTRNNTVITLQKVDTRQSRRELELIQKTFQLRSVALHQ